MKSRARGFGGIRAIPRTREMTSQRGCLRLICAKCSLHLEWVRKLSSLACVPEMPWISPPGGDFNKESDRRRAEEYVDKEEPMVIIGSTPCVAFSQLQSLVQDIERKAEQLAEGIRHMQFMVKRYKKQVDAGRIFVHENLAHAKSWALPCIKRMAREAGVHIVEADQCMFGLKTWATTSRS